MITEICPLCNSNAAVFDTYNGFTYFDCPNCSGIFAGKKHLPDNKTEIERYSQHQNDVNDVRYQNFVSPIVNAVLKSFTKQNKGLDFGAGTGPVISKMLKDKEYDIVPYDPFFHPNFELLQQKYDYIVSCEVIEHFHQPAKEFHLLKKMLQNKGKLYCMTSIYNKEINFNNWYYKNDPTHVFFYRKETMHYICKQFGFLKVETFKNLIIFSV